MADRGPLPDVMSGNGYGEHLFIAGSFFGMPLPESA